MKQSVCIATVGTLVRTVFVRMSQPLATLYKKNGDMRTWLRLHHVETTTKATRGTIICEVTTGTWVRGVFFVHTFLRGMWLNPLYLKIVPCEKICTFWYVCKHIISSREVFESTNRATFSPKCFRSLEALRERCGVSAAALEDLGVAMKQINNSSVYMNGKYIQQHLLRFQACNSF